MGLVKGRKGTPGKVSAAPTAAVVSGPPSRPLPPKGFPKGDYAAGASGTRGAKSWLKLFVQQDDADIDAIAAGSGSSSESSSSSGDDDAHSSNTDVGSVEFGHDGAAFADASRSKHHSRHRNGGKLAGAGVGAGSRGPEKAIGQRNEGEGGIEGPERAGGVAGQLQLRGKPQRSGSGGGGGGGNTSRYLAEFTELSRLGSGASGEVWKVRHRLDRRVYAVKKIDLNSRENHAIGHKLRREVTTISRLLHKHVVRYYAAWVEQFDCAEDDPHCSSKTGGSSSGSSGVLGDFTSATGGDHTRSGSGSGSPVTPAWGRLHAAAVVGSNHYDRSPVRGTSSSGRTGPSVVGLGLGRSLIMDDIDAELASAFSPNEGRPPHLDPRHVAAVLDASTHGAGSPGTRTVVNREGGAGGSGAVGDTAAGVSRGSSQHASNPAVPHRQRSRSCSMGSQADTVAPSRKFFHYDSSSSSSSSSCSSSSSDSDSTNSMDEEDERAGEAGEGEGIDDSYSYYLGGVLGGGLGLDRRTLRANPPGAQSSSAVQQQHRQSNAQALKAQARPRRWLFIQMEYCCGTLRETIDQGRVYQEVSQIVKLLRQLLEALAYIHGRRIIHRDLKVSLLCTSQLVVFVLQRVKSTFEEPYVFILCVFPPSPSFLSPPSSVLFHAFNWPRGPSR